MASLWDLINGYSQGCAPTEGSTQTLGQAARDLYQGLINPQAWQEVQQATKRTQQVIPSILESLGRGSVAQVPGTFGDISQLARYYAPNTMQSTFGNRVAPTTEEILQAVPRINPSYEGSQSHEMIGGLVGPALGKMLKMGAEATKGMKGGLSIEDFSNYPNNESIRNAAEDFLKKVKDLGFGATLQHSGSRAGPSSYVQLNEFKDPFRFSNHSKGAFNNQFVNNVINENHKEQLLKELELLAPNMLQKKQYNKIRQIKDMQENEMFKKYENPSKYEKDLDQKSAYETRKELLEKQLNKL
jgi:hypothetical protein